MAFPQVTGIVNSTQFTLSTTHLVTLPGSLAPGAPLLVIGFSNANTDFASWPEGFSLLSRNPPTPASGNIWFSIYGYNLVRPPLLPMLGVERGERTVAAGSSFTLTTPAARRSDIYAIAFAETTVPLTFFLFARSNGGATPINPPNLVYSGSAQDVLWWAIGTGIGWTPNGYPANYTLHQFFHTPAQWGQAQGSGICARELNAASEDPGTWPAAGGPTSDWEAKTMGVSLAGP